MQPRLPSPDNIAERLCPDHPEAHRDGKDLPVPLSNAPLRVTLEHLRPYEHNPRFLRNPRYAELKDSIRQRGLDQPPAITRRPGDSHYIIRNGGNTRLAILNELWRETNDPRFFQLDCLYKPWCGEAETLLGHLAENELHGSLSFVERALSVGALKALYEQDGSALTQSELACRLASGGYPISQPHISRMLETLQHLLPGLPLALRAGLGKPQIERLLALRRKALRLWERHRQAPEALPAIWLAVLAEHDNAGPLRLEDIQTDLVNRLHERLPCPPAELAAELNAAPPAKPVAAPERAPSPSPSELPPEITPVSRVERIRQQIAGLGTDDAAGDTSAPSEHSPAAVLTAPHQEIQHLTRTLASSNLQQLPERSLHQLLRLLRLSRALLERHLASTP